MSNCRNNSYITKYPGKVLKISYKFTYKTKKCLWTTIPPVSKINIFRWNWIFLPLNKSYNEYLWKKSRREKSQKSVKQAVVKWFSMRKTSKSAKIGFHWHFSFLQEKQTATSDNRTHKSNVNHFCSIFIKLFGVA